jgi:RNA polymerase sigma-70 factor (ECF subfamily)
LSLNESQLIKSAQAGDREAFSSLAEKFERRIYTLAFYYTRDPHDAEDLAQEVWLKAYGALRSFRGESSFYTWLRQITVNTFLNSRRGETLRRSSSSNDRPPTFELDAAAAATAEEMDNLFTGCAERVEDVYQRRILVEKVFRALGELTPQQRLIFLLKHREGMTYEEISKVLDCSTGTIKKALFRAVMKLRQQLGITPAPLEYAQCGAERNG